MCGSAPAFHLWTPEFFCDTSGPFWVSHLTPPHSVSSAPVSALLRPRHIASSCLVMGLPTGMSFGIYELQTHSRVPLIPLTCPPSSRLLGVSLHCPRLLLDVASSMLFLTPQTPDQLAMQSDASATHRELGCSPILPAMVPQSQISDLSAPGLWVALCASVCMHDFPVGLSNTQVSTAPSLSLKVQVQVCTVPQLARPCGTVSICPCATFQPFTQDLTNHGYLNHGQIHLPLTK